MSTSATTIADELRGQLRSGRLRPGDRMPSTRQITQRWGVAMATASRAIAELRDEGLIRVVPGVGTVVVGSDGHRLRPTPTAAPRRTSTLTAGRIVSAGLAVADAEGLAAVSMRRVAIDLGVATMALYRHVRDKDDLLHRMIEAVFAESVPPRRTPRGLRDALEQSARSLWQIYRSHPWLASGLSLSRPAPVASGLEHSDAVLATLIRHGFDPTTAFTLHLVLFNVVRGFAVGLETEILAETDTGVTADEWADLRRAELDEAMARLPLPAMTAVLASFGTAGYDFDLDALFGAGLGLLLDGIVAARPRS